MPADVHTNDNTSESPPAPPPDRSLQLMLTWVAIALLAALLLAFLGVEVVFWLFDR